MLWQVSFLVSFKIIPKKVNIALSLSFLLDFLLVLFNISERSRQKCAGNFESYTVLNTYEHLNESHDNWTDSYTMTLLYQHNLHSFDEALHFSFRLKSKQRHYQELQPYFWNIQQHVDFWLNGDTVFQSNGIYNLHP